MDNYYSLKAVTLMFLLLPFLFSSFARKRNSLLSYYLKKLIYEAQNNLL